MITSNNAAGQVVRALSQALDMIADEMEGNEAVDDGSAHEDPRRTAYVQGLEKLVRGMARRRCGCVTGECSVCRAEGALSLDPKPTPPLRSQAEFDAVKELAREQQARSYYQDLVYSICAMVDKTRDWETRTCCGTHDNPSDELPERVRSLFRLAMEGSDVRE